MVVKENPDRKKNYEMLQHFCFGLQRKGQMGMENPTCAVCGKIQWKKVDTKRYMEIFFNAQSVLRFSAQAKC